MMDLNWKGVRKQNKVHSNFEAHTILYKSGIMLIIVILSFYLKKLLQKKEVHFCKYIHN